MSRTPKYDFTEIEVVNYIINHECSIREAAKHYGCGKDVIFRKIKNYNGIKKDELNQILQKNIQKSRF